MRMLELTEEQQEKIQKFLEQLLNDHPEILEEYAEVRNSPLLEKDPKTSEPICIL